MATRKQRLQVALVKQLALQAKIPDDATDIIIIKVENKLEKDIAQLQEQISLEEERESVTQADITLLRDNGLDFDPRGIEGFTKAELDVLKAYPKAKRDAVIKLFQ